MNHTTLGKLSAVAIASLRRSSPYATHHGVFWKLNLAAYGDTETGENPSPSPQQRVNAAFVSEWAKALG
jgi:hypothetical protein